jgi:4-aminobutyrate aminotransferase-like enzyme
MARPSAQFANSLEGKSYFNTFGGDPMQSAQAKATMDVIAEEGLSENAIAMGARIVDGFKQMMSKHEMIGDVRGRGLLLGVELVKDRKSKAHASAETARLMDICKDHGVLLGKGGLYGNVVRVAPPMTINAEQVDHLLEVVDRALAEVGR